MRAVAALLIPLALVACKPAQKSEDQAPAAPSPTAGLPPVPEITTPFTDVDGRGNEPFWSVKTRGSTISLERAGDQALVAEAAPQNGPNGELKWVSDKLTVTARQQPGCSDGMSDFAYPLAIEVVVEGQTLKGCGAPAGELPHGEG
ncbi:MAG: hypothetical protein ABW042_09770 [Phenylobacterium sp.]